MRILSVKEDVSGNVRKKAIEYARRDIVRYALFLGFLYPPMDELGELFVVMSDKDDIVGMGLIYWDEPWSCISITGEAKSELLELIIEKMNAPFIAFCELEDRELYEKIGAVESSIQYQIVLREKKEIPQKVLMRLGHWQIERMTQEHLEELDTFYEEHKMYSWNRKMFEAGPYFCIRYNGKIIGAGGVHFVTPEVGQIGSVFIDENFRGKGLGVLIASKVIDEIYNGFRIISSFVFEENLMAVKTSQKRGFKIERKQLFLMIDV